MKLQTVRYRPTKRVFGVQFDVHPEAILVLSGGCFRRGIAFVLEV